MALIAAVPDGTARMAEMDNQEKILHLTSITICCLTG